MTVRIAQLTDIHVADWTDLRRRDLLTKRATGYFNSRYRRATDHDTHVVSSSVEKILDTAPDAVVVTGDLTNVGMRSELLAARRLLEPLAVAGIRIAVIPGNHDYYVPSCTNGDFEEVYADWLEGERVSSRPYPYCFRVGHVSVILFNSGVPTPPLFAYGWISPEQLVDAEALARMERDRGQQLWFGVHHHMTKAPHRRVEWTRNLRNATEFRELAASVDARLLLHGHNHHLHLRRMRDANDSIVVGLSSSSSQSVATEPRRGRLGLYELAGPEQDPRLSFSTWDPERASFGPWIEHDARTIPVETEAEVP